MGRKGKMGCARISIIKANQREANRNQCRGQGRKKIIIMHHHASSMIEDDRDMIRMMMHMIRDKR